MTLMKYLPNGAPPPAHPTVGLQAQVSSDQVRGPVASDRAAFLSPLFDLKGTTMMRPGIFVDVVYRDERDQQRR